MRKRAIKMKEYIDSQTGEVQRFLIIDVQTKDKDFIKVRKALTQAVMEDLRYLNGAVKLLFLIIDMAIEQGIFNKPIKLFLSEKEIAKKLGISERRAYDYIRLLKQKKYIVQVEKRQKLYLVNPQFLWIGDAKSYNQWLADNSQLQLFNRNIENVEVRINPIGG